MRAAVSRRSLAPQRRVRAEARRSRRHGPRHGPHVRDGLLAWLDGRWADTGEARHGGAALEQALRGGHGGYGGYHMAGKKHGRRYG